MYPLEPQIRERLPVQKMTLFGVLSPWKERPERAVGMVQQHSIEVCSIESPR
jgi:hypothetical protein